jgi:hypothetical protein
VAIEFGEVVSRHVAREDLPRDLGLHYQLGQNLDPFTKRVDVVLLEELLTAALSPPVALSGSTMGSAFAFGSLDRGKTTGSLKRGV